MPESPTLQKKLCPVCRQKNIWWKGSASDGDSINDCGCVAAKEEMAKAGFGLVEVTFGYDEDYARDHSPNITH